MTRDRILRHIRDARQAARDRQEVAARLTGIVIERRKAGSTLFWDVVDESGRIQIIIPEDSRSDEVSYLGQLDRRAPFRAVIHGTTGRSLSEEPSLYAEQVRIVEANDDRITSPDSLPTNLRSGHPIAALYLGRLMSYFDERLRTQEFQRLHTKLISTTWPEGGVYPLKVNYDGYGAPFFICVSPVPQLIHALANLPSKRVYSEGTCFTQSYRDPHVSTESAIICAGALDWTIGRALSEIYNNIMSLYDRYDLAPSVPRPRGDVEVTEYPSIRSARTDIAHPEIQIFPMDDRTVGRLSWPTSQEDRGYRYVFAEGYSQGATLTEGRMTVITIAVEQLLLMILDNLELRQIPELMDKTLD